jgi:hypothetical protein
MMGPNIFQPATLFSRRGRPATVRWGEVTDRTMLDVDFDDGFISSAESHVQSSVVARFSIHV